MARAPRLGAVKSRLAATLGDAAALMIYRQTAELALTAARASGLRTTVAFTPPDAEAEMRVWLGSELAYAPQSGGDLGHRMATAIARERAGGARAIVVVGTDCPGLTADHIGSAVAMLHDADVVYGPAVDGGYYLVATRAPHAALFDAVPWSSPETLAVSRQRASDAGLRVTLLPELRDVDTEDDWRWSVQVGLLPP